MIHYIKEITGLEYYPSQKYEYSHLWEVYAKPFEKYKVWDFFIVVFLPYYRTKIAKEILWKHKLSEFPNNSEIFNEKRLKDEYHILIVDGKLYSQPKITVTLSDGIKETAYFDTNNEAEKNAAGIIKEWGLKQYYPLEIWEYTVDKEK